jgi:hypothetical protein
MMPGECYGAGAGAGVVVELSPDGGVVLGSVVVDAGGVSEAAFSASALSAAALAADSAALSAASFASVAALSASTFSAAALSAAVSAFSFWLSQAATPRAPSTAKAAKNFLISHSPSRNIIQIVEKSRNEGIEAQPPAEIKPLAEAFAKFG